MICTTDEARSLEIMGACEFAAGVLGLKTYEPTVKQSYEGPSCECAVCGRPAGKFGVPWRRDAAISEGFAEFALMANCFSPAVCGACAYFVPGSTLREAAQKHGVNFSKTWAAMSWRSFSHVFAEPGSWMIPSQQQLRDFLVEPPPPPFLVVLTTKGRRNLLFRGQVANDRDIFPVLFEDEALIIRRDRYASALADFEAAMALGIRRKTLLVGVSDNGNDIQAAGLSAWRQAEALVAPWRAREQPMFRLVAYTAKNPKTNKENADAQGI